MKEVDKMSYETPMARELALCYEGIICLSGESGLQDYQRQEEQEW